MHVRFAPKAAIPSVITRSTATCQKPAFGCLHSRNDGIRKKLAAGLTSAPAASAYGIFFTSGHLDSDNG
jgi:hypothetical protein